MKRGITIILLLVLSLTLISAERVCDLSVSLINQDPYPAVPGDYVKLVFQIAGVDDVNCNDITFELLENYPIEFDPGESGLRKFPRVSYIKDYESNILIPYEVRINEDALDGANPIEVRVESQGRIPISKVIDIEVTDIKADFEIYVKDYSYATHELTFEILNIAEADVEALTLEIPAQEAITIKGANRVVVGDLDSNEYTTTDFEAVVLDGEFQVNLIYSDTINTRRTIQKMVPFDSSYFTQRIADQKTTSMWTYVIWAAIVLIAIWWGYKKFFKKKKK